MKKFLIILILATMWLGSNGQTGPVFPYDHPSLERLYGLASGKSIKAYRFRGAIADAAKLVLGDTLNVSEVNIDFIFNHLYLEEVYLGERKYMNSGFNLAEETMDPSIGHEWTGFAWVLRVGSYSSALIKEDCGNVLQAPVIRRVDYENARRRESNELAQYVGVIPPPVVSETPFSPPKNIKEMMTTSVPDTYQEPFIPTTTTKKKKWPWIVAATATVAAATITYLVLTQDKHSTPIAGGPAYVPMHRGFGR